VIDSQIIFAIIAVNACVLAAVFFGAYIFDGTVRSARKAAGVETQRQRAQRYRAEAEQCRADAAKTIDLMIRPCLLQFAQLREILADGIEAR
jgi:hypothetical protein